MARIKLIFPLGLFVFLLFTVSCKKDEPSSVAFMLKASESTAPVLTNNQQPPLGSSNANLPLEWNTAWIYITQLEFNAEFYGNSDINGKGDYPDFHYEWQGNQKIDLLGEPKIFANMDLPEGQFKRMDLNMTSARFGFTDEPNFYLSGTYGPVFGGTPISLSVTHEFEINMTYENGEAISNEKGDIFKSMVEISLDNVFNGITTDDLEKAELTDGWILISEDHNADLYAKILANLLGKPEQGWTWSLHKIQ